MKSKFLLLLTFLVVLVSCNFTENLNVKDDGTGTFALEVDGSGLMAMAGDKLSEGLTQKKDTKVVDSTFSFKEIFEAKKDSISKLSPEQQAALKKMENFVMRIKMDADKQQFLFSMDTPFKSVGDLQNMMDGFTTLKDLKGKSNKDGMSNPLANGIGNNTKIDYSYNSKTFVRNAIIDKEALDKIKNDSLGMTKMFLASSKYTLKYHFPKAVKKVSNPDALFSADRKTVTVEYPFLDYMEHPEKLNLNVSFE
jgi:hypothetical protein